MSSPNNEKNGKITGGTPAVPEMPTMPMPGLDPSNAITPYVPDETANRCTGVEYRLEGWIGRKARRRVARALKRLDKRLVRLAKQLQLTLNAQREAEAAAVHQRAFAEQPTSLIFHLLRKFGVIVAELGFSFLALRMAGIPNANLRFALAIALAGLSVVLGEKIARTMKSAHLASQQNGAPPTRWDWILVGVATVSIAGFAIALTKLRDFYNHAAAHAHAVATSAGGTNLTVVIRQHAAPGWVLGILALVAPMFAIFAEYAWHDPRAHRYRRSHRLYAWATRKLRHVLKRCTRPVTRGRLALLKYDQLRSRALMMKNVIHVRYGGTIPDRGEPHAPVDDVVRQLRDRLAWYDKTATLARERLLSPLGNPDGTDERVR